MSLALVPAMSLLLLLFCFFPHTAADGNGLPNEIAAIAHLQAFIEDVTSHFTLSQGLYEKHFIRTPRVQSLTLYCPNSRKVNVPKILTLKRMLDGIGTLNKYINYMFT